MALHAATAPPPPSRSCVQLKRGYNGLPTHAYVSSDAARDALVLRLLATGQVQSISYVPLNNAVDTATTTTDDHDG
jgi:hypothetical protein